MKIKKNNAARSQLEIKKFPLILKKLMEVNNIVCSNKNLAQMIGIPYSTLQDILNLVNTNPKISTLIPIAKFFNVSIEQLIGLEPLSSEEATEKSHNWNYSLYTECLEEVVSTLKKEKKMADTEQTLEITKKAYVYCLTKQKSKIDKEFISWLVPQYFH